MWQNQDSYLVDHEYLRKWSTALENKGTMREFSMRFVCILMDRFSRRSAREKAETKEATRTSRRKYDYYDCLYLLNLFSSLVISQ
jgi:hypothetical protein